MPRRRSLAVTAAALLTLLSAGGAGSLAAQRSYDESRLVIGVAGGWIGGKSLWSVRQPVTAAAPQPDLFDLHRELRSNITLAGQGTFFPSPHIGITGEATYLGIGTRDQCALINSSGDFANEAACRAINGDNRSASGVALLAGVVLRPLSRSMLQPYLRVLGGAALVPRSTVDLVAVFGTASEGALPIYIGNKSRQLRPSGALAFGIATAPRVGYQLRLEARSTWVDLLVVTAANPRENMPATSKGKYIALPSITLALDVVLEKRRGRRY